MAGTNTYSTSPSAHWGPSRPEAEERTRLRDVLPPIAAAVVIGLALFAYGAVQPAAALPIAAILTIIAIASVFVAGPQTVTLGMLIGAAVLVGVTVTGVAGPLHRSAPHLATLFAAGAMWIVGLIAARRRSALSVMWTTLIWASVAWCAWIFFAFVSATRSDLGRSLADAFETPANGALVFGVLAVLGMGRLLHLLKQADAEALAPSQIADRVLREGVGPILLLIGSLTCLVLMGSIPGMLFAAGVLVGQVWWDTLAITRRPQYGLRVRLVVILTPLIAIALVAYGILLGWQFDETVAPGLGSPQISPNIQRMDAYGEAWLQSPITGHGFGSITSEAARFQTLHNAKSMLAPGGPHNVFLAWLVQTGVVGVALFLWTMLVTHVRILKALTSRRVSRSFPRMAIAASALMLLHGVTDSSLNIPAIAWLYALLIGAACGLAPSKQTKTA